jgi:FMN-dependent NADH-azoreductase
MNVLHVCANPKPTEDSVCKQLAASFFAALVQKNSDVEMNNVDLYQDPPPYYDYSAFRGFWMPIMEQGYQPTDEEKAALRYASAQAELLTQADVLVLTTPMWNFSLPAILKAWIDQVLSPGLTFTLDRDGVHPLHKIRRIVMLVASGGVYKEDDSRDALTRLVRAAFGFVNITDVEIAWADGQNPLFNQDSDQRKQWAIEAAQEIAEDLADEG